MYAGTTVFFPADGLPPLEHIHAAGRALSWRFLGSNIALRRTVPSDGLCPTDVPGKPARHRGVPVGPAREALSYGLSWTGPPFDTGGCQSNPQLAHLRGIRPAVDCTGEAALCGRKPVGRFEGNRLRVGLDHHRFVPVVIPVGAFPVNESRREDAHIAGFTRQHTSVGQMPSLGTVRRKVMFEPRK